MKNKQELKREDFHEQLIVQHKKTRNIGVTCKNLHGTMGHFGPDEVPVVYSGSTVANAVDWKNLEILGPENAIADVEKCGAGKGEQCCIFLSINAGKPKCQRFGDLRWYLIFNTRHMTAKRHPGEIFPGCQFKE